MIRISIIGLFVLAVVYTLYIAQALFIPLLIALLLAVVLREPVRWLTRIRVPQVAAAALVVLVVSAALGYGAKLLADPAVAWVNRGPIMVAQVETKLGALRESFEDAMEVTQQFGEMANMGNGNNSTVIVEGPTLASQIFTSTQVLVINILVVIVLLMLMLGWGSNLRSHFLEAFPERKVSLSFEILFESIGRDVAQYLRTILVINIGLGVVVGGAMYLLDMPQPALWGALAGILNFIPYIGPLVTLGVIGMVSLLTFYSWTDILLPPLVFLALNGLEGYVVTPAIVGRRLILNPIVVFASIFFWGWLWGMAGALLALPILAAFKVICDHFDSLKRFRPLLQ